MKVPWKMTFQASKDAKRVRKDVNIRGTHDSSVLWADCSLRIIALGLCYSVFIQVETVDHLEAYKGLALTVKKKWMNEYAFCMSL